MNIKILNDMKKIVLMLSGVMLLWSCATSDKGELTGVKDRQIFEDIDLAGMVFVEQGNFIMGGGTQDNVYGVTSPLRTVQVGSFFMDEIYHILKAIAYFCGAVAYFLEILLLTDCFKKKVHHKELFMVYCLGPLYLLMGLNYILH